LGAVECVLTRHTVGSFAERVAGPVRLACLSEDAVHLLARLLARASHRCVEVGCPAVAHPLHGSDDTVAAQCVLAGVQLIEGAGNDAAAMLEPGERTVEPERRLTF
jgi:hypothetical protein